MTRLAGLTMYDLPEARHITDAWWRGVAGHLTAAGVADVPAVLSRPAHPVALWTDPRLLLAQTCGLPLTRELVGRVRLVATPCYAAPGCEGALYRSQVIVPAESSARDVTDLRGLVCAVNGEGSQSGHNALRALLAPLANGGRFFGAVAISGSHADSIALVQSGRADAAAIDAVTHAMTARHAPDRLAGTRVLCATAAAPGLPYITALATPENAVERLGVGLAAAHADPSLTSVREALLIAGLAFLPLEAYDVIPRMAREAAHAGYPELA